MFARGLTLVPLGVVRGSSEPNALEIHNCNMFGDLAWLCSVCRFGQVAAEKAVDTALVGVDRTAGRNFVAVHTDTAGVVDYIAAGLVGHMVAGTVPHIAAGTVGHTAAADTVLGIWDSQTPPVPGSDWATVQTSWHRGSRELSLQGTK